MKTPLRFTFLLGVLTFLSPSFYSQVVINEISSKNETSILDEYGESEDWIELYNAGATDVNLLNYMLSDDVNDLNKWKFPNVTIPSHGYLLLMASGNNTVGATYIHLNFKLDASGETLTLSDASGTQLDQYAVGTLHLDHSYGRSPDGTATWCVFNVPSPNATNNPSTCYTGYAPDPVFSVAPGFYPSTQTISISTNSGTTNIKYSLRGDVSAASPAYTAAITINTTSIISAINTGTGSLLSSNKVKGTYFINEDSLNLPIFSITMDSLDLWGAANGIYAQGLGTGFYANYWLDWTRACNIEYFDKNKNKAFEVGAGLKINGGYSRFNDQKSLRVNLKSKYGASSVNYPLIPDKAFITNYESFELKSSGTDGLYARMRDAFSQRIMKNTHNDYIAYEPALVFLNGKYWGQYEIKERQDSVYIENNHGVPSNKLDYLGTKWVTNHGVDSIKYNGSDTGFVNLHNYVIATSPTVTSFYSTMNNKLDLKNVTDYLIAQLYFDNWDWITTEWAANNIKFWRPRAPGGKWRYVLFDFDYTSDIPNAERGTLPLPLLTTLRHSTDPDVDTSRHTHIFKALLLNTQFKNDFINRYADLMNTTFQFSNIEKVAHSMRDSLKKVMPRHIRKWRRTPLNATNSTPLTYTAWLADVDRMVNFHVTQPTNVRNNLITEFGLNGTVDVTLDVLPAGAGKIQISTIIPDNLPWTGVYFDGVPVSITAIPNPGYAFNHWTPNALITNTVNAAATLSLTSNSTLTAHFTGALNSAPLLKFTEVNYNSDSTMNSGNWIELHNYDVTAIDLSGWTLKNSDGNTTFQIPLGTTVASNGYLVFCSDTISFKQIHPLVDNYIGQLPFNLKNSSDKVYLYDTNDSLKLYLNYFDTWAGCADGNGRTMELMNITPNINDSVNWFDGCMLGSPGRAYTPCDEAIIFSEINYHSSTTADAGDWVELYNTSSSPVDISGWNFKDSKKSNQFIIPANTSLASHGYLVLCDNLTKFNTIHPTVSNKIGVFDFNLGESGELIRLYDATGKIKYSVIYDDELPWPVDADGPGKTLEIINPQANVNSGTNWTAGCLKGSPGAAPASNCVSLVTSVSKLSKSDLVTIYPNPTNGVINIGYNGDVDQLNSITVFNSVGEQVYFSKKYQATIDLSTYPSGMYLLQIVTQNHSTTKKVSVVK